MLSNTWDARHRYFIAYLPIVRLYKAHSCYQNGKRNNLLSLKNRQMRRASRDIQGITKWLYSYIYLFFRKSKSFVKTKKIKASQYKTRQNNSRQFKASQFNSKQFKASQFKAIQSNSKQFKASQDNTIQDNTIQGNSKQFKAIQGKTRQWGDILPVIIVSFNSSHQFL